MDNAAIASVFLEVAALLQIQGDDPHRIRAFQRSAQVIESLPGSAKRLLEENRLASTPGLGAGSIRRIKDILRTGTCDEHRRLRRSLPRGLTDLLQIRGVGARTLRVLYDHLRVGSVEELERAILNGSVAALPRFGPTRAHTILAGIQAWKDRPDRLPWARAHQLLEQISGPIGAMAEVDRLAFGGSVRRGKATVGDLDLLVAAEDAAPVAARFTTLPLVEEVLVSGEGRSSVRLHSGHQCDLRVLEPSNFGAGLHYFTGSKLHNIAIRARGNKLYSTKISDKGIFRRHTEERLSSGLLEEEVFAAVGLPFIPPELRQDTGEIQAAVEGRLPKLVRAEDLRGDLHMHTTASDGRGSVDEMASAAKRLGHDYIAITDHSELLTVANGLSNRQLISQSHHIRDVEQARGDLRILSGIEVDIHPDGTLDLDAQVLAKLDWVVASVHTSLETSGADLTRRYVRAMETGLVDCIGHPTTRRLAKRAGVALDYETLFQAARRLDVAVEINGNPGRMDLPDTAARQARDFGVRIVVNTDAHAPEHLSHQEYGILTARRAWLEARDVLNTRPVVEIEDRRTARLRTHGIAVSGWSPPSEPMRSPTQPTDAHWLEPLGPTTEEETPDLSTPLSDDMKARVQRFLVDGSDTAMNDALEAIGPNAMAAAFQLLHG